MAKLYSYQDEGKKRKKLHEILPLKFPFSVDFFVSNTCNFRCFYCLHADMEHRNDYFKVGSMMSFQTFRRCIDNIRTGGTLKVLTLSGTGEPLLNPEIVDMVQYASRCGVSESVEIVSNGTPLTHTLSEQLARAGLNRLRISLQGLNAQDYKKVSNVDLDYDNLREEIRYFHGLNSGTVLYVKVMDFMVSTPERRERFFRDYDACCDQICVEHLAPFYPNIDYSAGASSFESTLHGEGAKCYRICTRVFFGCAIDYDGSILPCCFLPPPIVFGNAAEDFGAAWNGEKRTEFLLDLLREQKTKYATCAACKSSIYQARPSDVLDDHTEELIERYQKLLHASDQS